MWKQSNNRAQIGRGLEMALAVLLAGLAVFSIARPILVEPRQLAHAVFDLVLGVALLIPACALGMVRSGAPEKRRRIGRAIEIEVSLVCMGIGAMLIWGGVDMELRNDPDRGHSPMLYALSIPWFLCAASAYRSTRWHLVLGWVVTVAAIPVGLTLAPLVVCANWAYIAAKEDDPDRPSMFRRPLEVVEVEP